MNKRGFKLLMCVLLFGFGLTGLANGKNAEVKPRYIALKDRLLGSKLSPAEADQLLTSVKSHSIYTPVKKSSWSRKDKLTVCNNDEETYLAIERNILSKFFNLVSAGSWKEAEALLIKNPSFSGDFFSRKSDVGPYELYSWTLGKKETLSDFFSGFEKIESIDFETLNMKIDHSHRDTNLDFSEILLNVDFDIRGKSSHKSRAQASGYLVVGIHRVDGTWKISELRLEKGRTVSTNKAPSFAKLDNKKTFNVLPGSFVRHEAIRRGGYALAVNDYDGDNKPDLFVGSVREAQGFKNIGNLKFEADNNLPHETLVKSAAIADFDGDGKQDLLVVRFITEDNKSRLKGETAVSIYKNVGDGKFEKIKNPILHPNRKEDRAMPAAVADFNNDGFLDFYIGYPGVKDFTHPKANKNLNSHGLYMGSKSGIFTPLSPDKYQSAFGSYQNGFPHSALAADYNNDNLMDLLIVDDRSGLSLAFSNQGNGQFKQEAKEIGIGNEGYGMDISMADLNNDGNMDLVMTNVELAAGQRFQSSCYQNWEGDFPTTREEQLRVFLGDPKFGFQEVAADKLGLDHPGFGLSGVRFFDFDNDGKLDLFVTNGLWTGTNPSQRFDSYFVRSHLHSEPNRKGAQASLERSLSNRPQSVYMDILSFFKGDIFSENSDLDSRPSLAGFQRKRLYKNIGNDFIDVAYLEGVDSIADGYMVAASDLNSDGKTDLVLRNADPGSVDAKFDPLEIFINANNNSNALDLKLVGTTSNKDAIGARVWVTVGNETSTQSLLGLNGTVQSTKVLHFGLGNEKKSGKVKVLWPSGKITELKSLKKGFHTIVE